MLATAAEDMAIAALFLTAPSQGSQLREGNSEQSQTTAVVPLIFHTNSL